MEHANNAGYKAKADISKFLSEEGFQELLIPAKLVTLNALRSYVFQLRKTFSCITNGDTVVVQYPLEGHSPLNYMFMDKIYTILKKKKIKIITLVHDLNGVRYPNDRLVKNWEIKILKCSDYVIVHSEYMREWLQRNGVSHKTFIVMDFFDYFVDNRSQNNLDKSLKAQSDIVFAGNLNKSKFLLKPFNFKIDTYGPLDIDSNKLDRNVSYKGSVSPDCLISTISEYRFGLIWDGEETSSITGNIGEYLKYNIPHKASSYISAGLPIIVWSGAAIAKKVLKYEIGLVVDNLEDIPTILARLESGRYDLFKKNISQLRNKINHGYFIKKSIAMCDEKGESYEI